MPWKDKTVEEQRMEFVTRVLSKEKNKSALCREYGISRPTRDKNNKRPHAALNYDVPTKRYCHSPRLYNSKIDPWEYGGDAVVRQIKSSGYLTFSGQGFYLSEGLGGKEVAVAPTDDDGVFNILFRQFRVAKLNLNTNTISSRRIYLLNNDPRQIL